MKWWPEICAPGDMVRVSIGSVKHYGIFVSENEIIQFGPPPVSLKIMNSGDICVCSATAEEFSCGNIIERAVLDKSESKKRLPPEKTVEIARSRLGEKGYSLLHNNCEHFAYECVFGEKRSSQEDEARARWKNRPILDVYIAPLPEEINITPVACEAREAEIRNTNNEELRAARFYDWQVLSYAANRSFGLREEEISFRKASDGKWSCDKFFFSLSHTKGAVAVAVSNGKVGIDLENVAEYERKPISRGKLRRNMFRRICTEKEAQLADEKDFLPLWLKKESIFKCFGDSASPLKEETADRPAEVFGLKKYPDFLFCVCGEKLRNARFYLYENNAACAVNSEIVKSES